MVELTREIRGAHIPITAARGVVGASSNDWLKSIFLQKGCRTGQNQRAARFSAFD
jgi:hypothetical protein